MPTIASPALRLSKAEGHTAQSCNQLVAQIHSHMEPLLELPWMCHSIQFQSFLATWLPCHSDPFAHMATEALPFIDTHVRPLQGLGSPLSLQGDTSPASTPSASASAFSCPPPREALGGSHLRLLGDGTAKEGCHTQSGIGQRGMPGRLVTDSGLDAFSQYPSQGSIATPATRLIAETRAVA